MTTPSTPDVFVVDDNNLVRTGIVRMLENENLVVKEFDRPRPFIAEIFAAKTLPRIIISDFDMPEMNGLEIIQMLKSSPAHKHLPVLVVSAQINPEIHEKAVKAGAVAWIKKSAIGNDMLPAVRKFILGR
ncbi:MAG: response regulator [Candidatus Kapaibacterium sp.]|nr:MAG: response regulator [Candidatus Kapabacteria bacterium]